jgi:four helix bundle protein
MQIRSPKELIVYEKAYTLAMEIYRISKNWPNEEKFALIDQIRRSSRSVCTNLREAWRKRRYQANFISKLTDADGENGEADTRLDFAKDCGYLSIDDHGFLTGDCGEVGAMIGSMIKNPGSFLLAD